MKHIELNNPYNHHDPSFLFDDEACSNFFMWDGPTFVIVYFKNLGALTFLRIAMETYVENII